MRILKLTISGFRSFGSHPVTILFDQKIAAFIGLNSAGKTAALSALQKLFGERKDRLLYREDFHIGVDQAPSSQEEKKLWIETTLGFDLEDEAIPDYFNDMVVQLPGKAPFIRIRLEATWTPSVASLEGEVEAHQYVVRVPEGAPEDAFSKKDFPRFMYDLFQVIYVPALRKTAEQLKYASGSILYRLLNNVDYTDQFRTSFKEVSDDLSEIFRQEPSFHAIQDRLQTTWSTFHTDLRYQATDMNFGTGQVEDMLRKLEINFAPGPGTHRRFGVDDLGDGYRSLFYFSLVCTLLEIEDALPAEEDVDQRHRPLLTVLAVEEPENHIAPQLLGRVVKILEKMATRGNTQVFFSSHTPAIIKRIDPENICHFRIREDGSTAVSRIELPVEIGQAYKYVKEAVQNYPEIYFAKLVVIGEGDSEELVFNRLMKVLDTDFDDNIISFAPLGHRFVSHIWKLLAAFNIPHITLLDLDLGRHGGGWGRIKYALQQLIKAGADPNVLLKIDDSTLSVAELGRMDKWDNADITKLKQWLLKLRRYNVYFSAPLDLDFLMLEAYEEYYTGNSSYPKGGGPDIPDERLKPEKYRDYLRSAIGATLKDETAIGELYSETQRKLMIWYKYHFLSRGKPVTHMQVLSQIEDNTIKDQLPGVIRKIFSKIEALLSLPS